MTVEAFLSGKPVITTSDAGGPTEFVEDGKTGFVVDPERMQIAQKIEELWNHKDEAQKMGANGRQLINNYEINWRSTLGRLLGD